MSAAVPPPTDAPAPTGVGGPPVFPEVWARRDLPGLPWCVAKGVAKAIVLVFFYVLLPLELIFTVFNSSGIPISSPWSEGLITFGGGALALTSGGFTATQTTRLYGLFRMANRATKVAYLYTLATLATWIVGPIYISGGFGGGSGNGSGGPSGGSIAIHFGFGGLILLFMIGTTIATIAAFVTLYEDLKHPGERLPWDFPISRRERRRREQVVAASVGMPPPR